MDKTSHTRPRWGKHKSFRLSEKMVGDLKQLAEERGASGISEVAREILYTGIKKAKATLAREGGS